MTQQKVLARDLIVQVSDGAASPTWLGIAGKVTMTVNPGEQEQAADITTTDSAGLYEEIKMQRGASVKLEGFLTKDNQTGVQDPGQARCEALGALVGYASQGSIRFRHPQDSLWKVWTAATFSPGEQGGGVNDPSKWSVNVMRSGASTTAAAP